MTAAVLFDSMVRFMVAPWAESAAGIRGYIAGEAPLGLLTVNAVPAARFIEIRHRITRRVAASGFSNEDGSYRFDGLPAGELYDVIGRDYLGTYNDVIMGGIEPYSGPYLGGLAAPYIVVGDSVSWQATALFGELPYTWSATGLPGWLSISTDGLLTGTAPGTGSSTTATITCTDAHGSATAKAVRIVVAAPTVVAWWRVYVTATNGDSYLQIGELQFRGVAGGSNSATGGSATGSSTYSSNVASRVFDGNDSTYWITNGGAMPQWIYYAFPSALSINEVVISGSQSGYTGRSPRDFVIQSSVDGTTWVDEWTVSGSTTWSANETRTFTRP